MAFTQSICTSFKKEILQGTHDLANDTIKIALYGSNASLDETTTAYTTTGEITDTDYTAGGYTLTLVAPTTSGTTAIADISNLTVTNVTLTAHGGLIYNSSQSNKAIAVVDFGGARTNTGSDFVLTFPAGDAENAIIRIL